MNILVYQNLTFQLTHHILISILIPSTNLFFQLTNQFNWVSIPITSTNLFFQVAYQFNLISIPILSTKVLLMYLMTICLYANQLMYQKKVRRKNVQGHKSKKLERNAEIYPVLSLYKESRSKRCIIKFSSYDRALTNSWLCKRKLSFTEHFQWLVAYINQVDLKKKLKDGGRPSSREYLLPLKDSENVIVCRSMFLNTLGLKSNGMIIKMVRAQRQSYDGAIAPGQD